MNTTASNYWEGLPNPSWLGGVFFKKLKLTEWHWHWLIILYKVQVYDFITHHLYIALYAHCQVSSPSIVVYLALSPIVSLTSFPSHHNVVCVYEFVLSVVFCFISSTKLKLLGSCPFRFDIFSLAWFSQDLSMSLSLMAVFHLLLCLSSIPLYIHTTLYLIIHRRTLSTLFLSWLLWIMPQWT